MAATNKRKPPKRKAPAAFAANTARRGTPLGSAGKKPKKGLK
jgi:hypothetical protein